MSDHAELSPSASERWLNCHASIIATRGFASEDNEYSLEGTDAHTKLELWLSFGVPPTDGILYGFLEHAYLYVLDLERQGYEVEFERRLRYNRHVWGTADILARRRKSLHIGDYKHGFKVVEAERNPQMATYGVAAVAEFGAFNEYTLTVIQPRVDHVGGAVRSWATDDEFISWHRAEIEYAIGKIYGADPKFVPGRHCRYCPLEGDCSAFTNWIARQVTGEDLL